MLPFLTHTLTCTHRTTGTHHTCHITRCNPSPRQVPEPMRALCTHLHTFKSWTAVGGNDYAY